MASLLFQEDKDLIRNSAAFQELYKEFIALKKAHRQILYKRQYVKFKKSQGFYIVSLSQETHFKAGSVDGVLTTVDNRLAFYRSLYVNCKIHKIIYFNSSKDLLFFEELFNRVCEKQKIGLGHEQFIQISLSDILEKFNKIITFANFEDKIIFEDTWQINRYNACIDESNSNTISETKV